MTEPVRKLCIIGVGLIGGSFARALRAKGLVHEVIGCGRSRKNLEEAKRLGVVDRFTHDPAEAAQAADLIFLATPVRAMPGIVKTLRGSLTEETLLTDAGSTKANLIRSLEPLLPPGAQFVPGHPIAGKELTGVTASSADLFTDRWTILTPTGRTDGRAVDRVRSLWEQCGAQVELMDPELHDRVLGGISHLPHLVAYALVDTLMRWDRECPLLRYSAGGFKDFTRVAGSSPEMWRDICLENREAIIQALDRYGRALTDLRRLVEAGDAKGLERVFASCREVRARLED